MKILAVILSIAAVCSASHPPPSPRCSAPYLCLYRPDGDYVYPPGSALTPNWYRCSANYNLGCLQCQENLFYSQHCKACLKKIDVLENNCPTPAGSPRPTLPPCGSCKNRNDGNYQAPYNKHQFYSCVDGHPTECRPCPSNLVFSEKCDQCLEHEKLDTCSRSGGVNQKAEQCPAYFCMSNGRHRNGDYERDRYPSGTFHTCTEGTCFVRHCAPAGTVFSEACGRRCVFNYYTCDRKH